jgi:hypothetical protein
MSLVFIVSLATRAASVLFEQKQWYNKKNNSVMYTILFTILLLIP